MNYNSADYNAFGYDAEECIAMVAAYFYGPAWQPVHSHGIPWPTSRAIGPPQYGPPASWQIPSLPDNFMAHLPPCYIRQPGAYLLGPNTFNTTNFAALFLTLRNRPTPTSLEAQYGRHILEGLPVGEVQDRGEF
jgi:hypothetical protein